VKQSCVSPKQKSFTKKRVRLASEGSEALIYSVPDKYIAYAIVFIGQLNG
jgi:hypothetical protein